MSGGYFDYKEDTFKWFVIEPFEETMRDIRAARKKAASDEGESSFYQGLSDETVALLESGLVFMRAAYAYAHRIDRLLSADDGEESFQRRLRWDLEKASITEKEITDSFLTPEGSLTRVFRFSSPFTTADVGVGYNCDNEVDWATIYAISTAEEEMGKGHASKMVEFLQDRYPGIKTSVPISEAGQKLMEKYKVRTVEEKEKNVEQTNTQA